jgi:hypothetical protein
MKSALRWMSAAWVATGLFAAWSGYAFADAKIGVAAQRTKDMPISHGIFNMSTNNLAGLDQRARVMVEIAGGKWKRSGD